MPTPWPKPAPRMVRRVLAACAGPGRAVASAQARGSAAAAPRWIRVGRTGEDVTLGETPGRGRSCEAAPMSSTERNAADLFVECLEAEGVEYVFGIPGEETLDLNRAIEDSDSITFVPVRHEQGGAYMADMYGRLTHRAGVCLGTLGPGATNLVTAVADAWLDRSPMVVLTGQGDLERTHKESHQYIDIVSMFKPITKWNTRLNAPGMIPEAVRKAFKVAQAQKPGPTHIELPEDVMESGNDDGPLLHRQERRRPEPSGAEFREAAAIIAGAEHPIVLAGNGVARGDAASALRAFAHATGMGVAATF